MGEYYQLPRYFYRLHKRFQTPAISLAFFGGVAAILIILSRGSLDFLADLYNFGAMLAFFSAHLSLIVLRIKRPDLPRPFKIPFNIPFGKASIPITAIIGCLATMAVWFLIVFTKPDGRNLGFGWMIFGLGMYFLYRRFHRLGAAAHVHIEEVTVPGYQPMGIKHILVPTRGGMQTETVQMACEIAKLHGAKITAIQVIEIPTALPLDMDISHRMPSIEAILKRAEAIARDLNVPIELKVIRSRSIPDSILEFSNRGEYDLLVLGALKSSQEVMQKGLGPISERILRECTCRVWVCASEPTMHEKIDRLLPEE